MEEGSLDLIDPHKCSFTLSIETVFQGSIDPWYSGSTNGSNDSFNENPNMPITPLTPDRFLIWSHLLECWHMKPEKMTSGLLTPCRGFYFHPSSGISDTSPGQILISPDVDELDLLGYYWHIFRWRRTNCDVNNLKNALRSSMMTMRMDEMILMLQMGISRVRTEYTVI